MKRQTLALLVGAFTLVAGVVVAKVAGLRLWHESPSAAAPEQKQKQDWRAGDYTLSGPYTHENLTVFLIHGTPGPAGEHFLTLEEAMARKVVIVHETEEVNELAVENVSRTEEVFIQAGDIVKGGQQDRMLAVDLIVPARSGRVPVDAFCVEHGRWTARGGEPASAFTLSEQMASTKELKMAAKQQHSQAEVWARVDEAQAKLSASTNADVRASASASSYQLSLENDKVRASADEYVKALSGVVEGKRDVLGFAFAVNGRVSSADLYASPALFRRLWPKLLKASAVEALAERTAADKLGAPTADAFEELFVDAGRGREEAREVTRRTRMVKREGERAVFFETRDMQSGGAWFHRNYLAR
ncbi:MAG TPA: DUF6569 family protein [Pyrinomonadaceae bacterium]|nr:DUF6569 family protein [Pyrinomonadaceae bacterium]